MSTKKILVVDDEPNNLQLLRQILKNDYTLTFAKNGLEAITSAEKHRPDLILMDIMMPEMDGYQACRDLKKKASTAQIPVIFVTAMGQVEDESLGFEAGAVDYLTKPVSPPVVKARVKIHLSLVQANALEQAQKDAVFMLGDAGHYNDSDTGDHIWRMADYAHAIAQAAGWDEERCDLLRLAAPMHDTGKIGIPDAILKKPDKLDAQEWETMKTHSEIGYGILSTSQTPLFQLAAEVARYHHEKWDGSGYPQGLSGKDIPESVRIVAIADVFDALSMKRPYKEAWPIEEVISEIKKGSGQHFDPDMVSHFMESLEALLKIQAEYESRKQGISQ